MGERPPQLAGRKRRVDDDCNAESLVASEGTPKKVARSEMIRSPNLGQQSANVDDRSSASMQELWQQNHISRCAARISSLRAAILAADFQDTRDELSKRINSLERSMEQAMCGDQSR